MENESQTSNETPNTETAVSQPVVQATTPVLADLRKRIAEGLKAGNSEQVTAAVEQAGAQPSEEMRATWKKVRESLQQKPEYRKLKFGDDGLYVCIAEMIYGKFASLTKTEESGIFVDLLCLPFASSGVAEESRKRIVSLANKLTTDLRPAMSAKRFKIIETVTGLLIDGVTDFANLVPNSHVMREIVAELNRKTATLRNVLKNTWSLACYSFLQDVLHDALSDRTEPEVHDAADAFAKGFTTYLTQLQRAISFIDQDSNGQVLDFTYETVSVFKAAGTLKSVPSMKVNTDTKMDFTSLATTQKNAVRALFGQESLWLDLPFLPKIAVTKYRHDTMRVLLKLQTEMAQGIKNTSSQQDLQNSIEYGKRLAALHDRVSTLTARYGGVFEVYGANGSERKIYTDLARRALTAARQLQLNPGSEQITKGKIGAVLHELRAELSSVVDHILDSNIEPANLRDMRMSAIVAVVSYFVDMHKAMMSFLDDTEIEPANAKSNSAFGYISWLKGLAEDQHTSSLFKLHTPADEEESWDENFHDLSHDGASVGGEEDLEELGTTGKLLSDSEPSANMKHLCSTITGFAAFYADWSNVFSSEEELVDFWDDNIEMQVDYGAEAAKATAGTAAAAVATTTTTAGAPDAGNSTSSEAKPLDNPELILQKYKGSHDVLLKHHKNAPLYYDSRWGAYWDEYESNLKKRHSKKVARGIRREEEDVVGILMYQKNSKRLPYAMFFRSYVKKPSYSTTTTPPVQPKPEDYKHYYFAYGSNLDAEQVEKRTPFAKFVGRAVLKNYKLTFITYNYSWKGGVANVEPSEGDVVYGVLWAFTDEMRTKMDRYEGHPTKYVRHEIEVRQVVEGEIEGLPREIKADVYEIKNATEIHDFYPASDKYFDQIKAGYTKYKFPVVLLEEAQKFSTDNKVERKSSTTYYDGWGDDYYYSSSRRWGRGYYGGSGYQRSSGAGASGTASTTSYPERDWDNGYSSRSGTVGKDSLFHLDRWLVDMNKEWWEVKDV